MTLAAKLRRAPGRIATGAFILNSGLGKIGGGDEQAKGVHGMVAGAYPFVEKVPPKTLLKAVGAGEIGLGAGLLLPIVPAGLAGLALTGFAGSLLGMWWRTPGMHAEGSPRPTQQGLTIAKDVWMLGIGTSLVIDAALTESKVTGDQARAEAKATLRADAKAAKKAAARAARTTAKATHKATHKAQKKAQKKAGQLLPG